VQLLFANLLFLVAGGRLLQLIVVDIFLHSGIQVRQQPRGILKYFVRF
jgi:hypothetical protein